MPSFCCCSYAVFVNSLRTSTSGLPFRALMGDFSQRETGCVEAGTVSCARGPGSSARRVRAGGEALPCMGRVGLVRTEVAWDQLEASSPCAGYKMLESGSRAEHPHPLLGNV